MNPAWHQALRAVQPEAWLALRGAEPAVAELTELPAPDFEDPPLALLVYGLGTGAALQRVLGDLPAEIPVHVFESNRERAAAQAAALPELLADTRLRWWIHPDLSALNRCLDEVLWQLQDRLGLAWLELQPESHPSPFLTRFRAEARAQQQRQAPQPAAMEALYQELAPASAQAYASYPLSCRQGCDGCCKRSIGFYLLLDPLEWERLHRALWQLEPHLRHQLWQNSVRSLAAHADELVELLTLIDAQPERLADPLFHLELANLAGVAERTRPCVWLHEGGCSVYAGRPLTCRLYGNSQVQYRRPFTCELDWEQQQTILAREGTHTRLVESTHWRTRAEELHVEMPHKQVMNLWVLTHLDLAARDFKPTARLDYQQFALLARDQDRLDAYLAALQDLAAGL
ncbi:MAG: hypothetical protein ACO1RX_16965 [Candidatus Sericytochromatia bacterium]